MERKYYEINENSARLAKQMMSFNDYVMGSKTAEYRSAVDKVYDLAEKAIQVKPRAEERIIGLAYRYAAKLAEWYNKESSIGCMCPSVMISGAGNFPVRKKEKQNAAWERNMQFLKDIEKYQDRIVQIMTGKEPIMDGDADAIERLRDKIEGLEKSQQLMKDVNAYYRKHKTLDGCELLPADQIAKLQESMAESWHLEDKPFASYSLTNNNANIRRLKNRLNRLEDAKSQESTETENEFFRVVENTEIMRVQIFFDEKPEADVRDILKKNGFRFSPKNNNAWQRQLNNAGRYAVDRVIAELKNM
jgi:hypothetical protein